MRAEHRSQAVAEPSLALKRQLWGIGVLWFSFGFIQDSANSNVASRQCERTTSFSDAYVFGYHLSAIVKFVVSTGAVRQHLSTPIPRHWLHPAAMFHFMLRHPRKSQPTCVRPIITQNPRLWQTTGENSRSSASPKTPANKTCCQCMA